MARFEAMWADDAWEPGRDAEQRAYLSSCLQAVRGALEDAGCQVEWKCYGSAAGASVEAGNAGNDFRLAVVDVEFGTEQWNWQSVVEALARRSIPYIMFTRFPADAELSERLRNDPLRLATFEKNAADVGTLVAQVVAFFRAPPLRILHLTDLHVRAKPQPGEAREQEQRFQALNDCLEAESAVRPFDAVALTGDFAAGDAFLDLAVARQRVRKLIELAVMGDAERAFVIPGNHDIHWRDFAARELADQAWQPYLDFYQACAGGRQGLLSELAAWDGELHLMRRDVSAGALMWHRALPTMRLSVLGLATPLTDIARQGQGEFAAEYVRFVQRHWPGVPAPGEVRLALMHHNLFSVFSASAHEEQHVLHGAGLALQTLISARCHLVLSGHTHATMVMQTTAARLTLAQWSEQGTLTAISAGTAGGAHPSQDRARVFNILEIGDGRTGEPRSLAVRTFAYDSGAARWEEMRPFAGLALHS
ncbi:metallophosphoesterase [Longimicrobium sp.]|uniref:metallophosphoesterase n=1 Tax=Longimicrobium sp. TaxID=2029185 RepID=UPI002E304259|nr:metallophosphoesterase [Longimicrobium sp.]HEX6042562.1 metallophosphoesterase [Longimicrobium sp.]